jgi:ferredoxin
MNLTVAKSSITTAKHEAGGRQEPLVGSAWPRQARTQTNDLLQAHRNQKIEKKTRCSEGCDISLRPSVKKTSAANAIEMPTAHHHTVESRLSGLCRSEASDLISSLVSILIPAKSPRYRRQATMECYPHR